MNSTDSILKMMYSGSELESYQEQIARENDSRRRESLSYEEFCEEFSGCTRARVGEANQVREIYEDYLYERTFEKTNPEEYKKWLLDYAHSADIEANSRELVVEVSYDEL